MPQRRDKRPKVIDYNRKRYRNPFFEHKTNQNKRKVKSDNHSWVNIALSLLYILVISAIFWGICFSPWLNIESFTVSVPPKINKLEVDNLVNGHLNQKRFFLFPQRNILFYNPQQLERTINSSYILGSLDIKTEWPNKLIIKLEPKTFDVAWQENGKYFFINKTDFIANEITEQECLSSKLPLIVNNGLQKIYEGKLTAAQDKVISILATSEIIKDRPGRLGILKFAIEDNNTSYFYGLTSGPKIKLSIREDLNRQLTKYQTAITQGMQNDLNNKKIIDLRFGDKIYYE